MIPCSKRTIYFDSVLEEKSVILNSLELPVPGPWHMLVLRIIPRGAPAWRSVKHMHRPYLFGTLDDIVLAHLDSKHIECAKTCQ